MDRETILRALEKNPEVSVLIIGRELMGSVHSVTWRSTGLTH